MASSTKLQGTSRDDTLLADSGFNMYMGGGGYDTLIYTGSIFDFEFEARNLQLFYVAHLVDTDKPDVLIGIEQVDFADYTLFTDGRNNAAFTRDEAYMLDENDSSMLADLLDNDFDADGDTLNISSVTQGTLGGSVSLLANGVVQYNSGLAFDWLAAGEEVIDEFTYVVSDGGGGFREANVSMTITGLNDVVVAGESDLVGSITELPQNNAEANTDTLYSQGTLAFSDADLGDVHSVTVTALGENYLGTFTQGELVRETGAVTGELDWLFQVADVDLDFLAEGQVLQQFYQVSIDDGHGSVLEQTIEITLTGTNEAPTLTPVVFPFGNLIRFGQEYSFQITGLFTDPNGDSLTYTVEDQPDGFLFDTTTGVMSGIGADDSTGTHVVTFTATDIYGASASRTVSFFAPDPTPQPVDDIFTITDGLTVSGNLALNDPRATFGVFQQFVYEHTYAETTGVVNAGPLLGNATLEINPDGTFTYTADSRVWGSDQFAYTVMDEFGHSTTAVATIVIPERVATANNGDLGALDVKDLTFEYNSKGVPISIRSASFTVALEDIAAFASGSTDDVLDQVLIGAVLLPGQILAGVSDPDDTTAVLGEEVLITLSAAFFNDPGIENSYRLIYGFEHQNELYGNVDLRPDDGSVGGLIVQSGTDLGYLSFAADLNVIDDRSWSAGASNGEAGSPGELRLRYPDGVEIPINIGIDWYVLANWGQVILDYFEGWGTSKTDIYRAYDGANGETPAPNLRIQGGSEVASVMFGADGANGGQGGAGANGSNGGDGFIVPITPLAAFTVDGAAGGDGGDGGEGAATLYHLIGSTQDDVIIGGRGGDVGANGEDGLDGNKGADVENLYSGGISGGEVANGGAGGAGGEGGLGGFTQYAIIAGAGDDMIYGGSAGKSSETVTAQYLISAGAGNDTVMVLNSLSGMDNVVHNERGQVDYATDALAYIVYGDIGDDTLVFTTETIKGGGSEGRLYSFFGEQFYMSLGLKIDGGEGFDTLVVKSDAATTVKVALGEAPVQNHHQSFVDNQSLIQNIEKIEIEDGALLDLYLTPERVVAMTDAGNILFIEHDLGSGIFIEHGDSSRVNLRGDWEVTEDALDVDGTTYDLLYDAGTGASLYIDYGYGFI